MPRRLDLAETFVTLAVLVLCGVLVVAVPLRLAGKLPIRRGIPPPLAETSPRSAADSAQPMSAAVSGAPDAALLASDSPVHQAFPPYTPMAAITVGATASAIQAGVSSTASLTAALPSTALLSSTGPLAPTSPLASQVPSTTPLAAQSPATTTSRVGILAGHWQYDTGTVCADGRREVDVTLDVARRTKNLLEARGFTVDLLPELDPNTAGPPLQGYHAAAFVSIHADSCDLAGYSGFKISRWRYSNIPTVDDRLVACLYENYAAATGLPRHDTTVSINMWNYYAFRELAVETPAAIIELGFMGDDRAVLDGKRYEIAEGVASGVACFLGR